MSASRDESDAGSWPSLLYVTTDCEELETACLGFQDFYAVWSEVNDLEVAMEKDVDYFIIVDGDYTSDLGPFKLIVTIRKVGCVPANFPVTRKVS